MADIRLIPGGIQDSSTLAMNELIDDIANLDLTVLLVYIVDNVAKSALVHLAQQFHVMGSEGWNLAVTTDQKRQLIKQAIELHRYKGTKYAIQQVISNLGLEGEVLEWFQYDGDPYYFKVIVDIYDRGITGETQGLLEKLILEWKNVRSELEQLKIYLSNIATVEVRAVTMVGTTVEVQPWQLEEIEAVSTVPKAICVTVSSSIIEIFPYEEAA